MEYYQHLHSLVDKHIGYHIANATSLDTQQQGYISHGIIWLVGIFLLIQILSFFLIRPGKQPNRPSQKTAKKHLVICGSTNSGKTQLFYHLLTKEVRTTVSSTEINETNGPMEVKIPGSAIGMGESQMKAVSIIDIPGHFHFKEKVQETLEEAKAIILILDSKEKERFGDSAEVLYDILSNITVLSDKVPILVACNKQDLQFAKKATTVEQELEKEIEELRKVRRATQDETMKMGYLESMKKKFSFNDLQVPVKFVECSIAKEDLAEVYKFIYSHF